MMKNFLKLSSVGLVAGLMLSTPAFSQNLVDYGQAIKSLQATGNTSRGFGIDVNAIKQSINQKISQEGTQNAKNQSTVLGKLKTLPQLIVQVQYETNSALIRPGSWETVGKIADALHHPLLAGDRFLLVGHSDASGKRTYNLALSERRALSLSSMLIDVYNISPRRLIVLGLGEEQLRDPANPDGQANRRVELFNLGPK